MSHQNWGLSYDYAEGRHMHYGTAVSGWVDLNLHGIVRNQDKVCQA